jgi:hypothetical protein
MNDHITFTREEAFHLFCLANCTEHRDDTCQRAMLKLAVFLDEDLSCSGFVREATCEWTMRTSPEGELIDNWPRDESWDFTCRTLDEWKPRARTGALPPLAGE